MVSLQEPTPALKADTPEDNAKYVGAKGYSNGYQAGYYAAMMELTASGALKFPLLLQHQTKGGKVPSEGEESEKGIGDMKMPPPPGAALHRWSVMPPINLPSPNGVQPTGAGEGAGDRAAAELDRSGAAVAALQGAVKATEEANERQDKRVTIYNRVEQRKLSGNSAPFLKNVNEYLAAHPEWEVRSPYTRYVYLDTP